MRYTCERQATGDFVAVIADAAGNIVDTSAPFPAKHFAMDLRDKALVEQVSAFADIGKPPQNDPAPEPQPAPVIEPPAAEPVAEPAPDPAPDPAPATATKPKAVRKPKASVPDSPADKPKKARKAKA